MLDYLEPLLIVAAFALAYDYRRPDPLLFGRVELIPVPTLEERRAEEWLAQIRVGPLAPHTGSRAKSGKHSAGRRQSRNPFPASHYYRNH
jgi:hypothetical protein